MATCPDGHSSAATDFCDVCGLEITATAAPAPTATAVAEPASAAASAHYCPRCGEPREEGARFCEGCSYDFVAAPPVVHPATPAPLTAPVVVPPPVPAPAAPPQAAELPVLGFPAPEPEPAAPEPEPAQAEPPVPAPAGAAWTATVTADRAYYEVVRAETADDPDGPDVPFPVYCPERTFELTGEQLRIGRRSRSQGVTPEIDLTGPPADPGISHLHALLVAQPDGTWAVVDPGSTNGTTINDDTEPIAENIPVPLHDGDRVHVGAWTTITLTAPVG